jgi:hypothetical protein
MTRVIVIKLDTPADPAFRLGWGESRLDATWEQLDERHRAALAQEAVLRAEAKRREAEKRARLAALHKSKKLARTKGA